MPFNLISLLLAGAALGWGWLSSRKAAQVGEQLQNVRNSHFRLADQSRERLDALENEVRTLKVQLRAAQNSGPLFTPEMTVADASLLDERVSAVLGAMHIGGCDSCAISPEDTIAQAALNNGQDLARVLVALNRLPTPDGDSVLQELQRKPNVQINV